MSRNALAVAVIGGGIGGLAAGLSLLNAGIDVHVYERARALSEIGAGIQVSPNASRVLDALARALPAERLHVGHRLTRFADRGGHVEAEFENGTHISVDALVGADGIHSTVRGIQFGPGNPHFTGCAAYRGLVPADWLATSAWK